MKIYTLNHGDTLRVSVDEGPWEVIRFDREDFGDIAAAGAEELAAVIGRVRGLKAGVAPDGSLVVETESRGGHVTLEVDPAGSSAAASLGLAGGRVASPGSGLRSARVVGQKTEPFTIREKAELRLIVDGAAKTVVFRDAGPAPTPDRTAEEAPDAEARTDAARAPRREAEGEPASGRSGPRTGITPGKASAEEVVAVINQEVPGLARVTRDGRIMLTSPTVGPDSRLVVEPGGPADAAPALGLIGPSAESHPYPVEPARLVCDGSRPDLRAVNLTAGPIELHLPTGTATIPARGTLTLPPGAPAFGPLRRLIDRGSVRLVSSRKE